MRLLAETPIGGIAVTAAGLDPVLWHLDIFRRSFRDLVGHVCMAESCIFCALKELFAQFQYSQESALPPDALRRALAETFFDQRRFQLGFMDDAAECFENMLLRIHYHLASHDLEEMCSVGHCIPHQKFAMTLVEQTICHMCGATSEPLPFTQMVHYVSASALCAQAGKEKPASFGELLYKAGGMGDIRDCPSSCGAKIQICRTLMNKPDIVSCGLVWDSERPTVEHIVNVLDTIGTSLRMHEMFHTVVDQLWAQGTAHNLVGIVTYYGKHYSTFFFHTKLRVWIYFDDATVREIGPHWQQVVEKCRKGHFQPLLLLYANPNGTPVHTASAPKAVLHCSNAGLKNPSELNKFIIANSEVPSTMSHYANAQQWIQNNWHKTGEVPTSVTIKDFRPRTFSDSSVAESPLKPPQGKAYDDEFLNDVYINRQIVESVLTKQRMHQRHQRLAIINAAHNPQQLQQGGVRTSSSSLESFENSLREKMLEQLQEGRRRDSGNWSGERNSSSSSSSTSLDNPYALPNIKRFQKSLIPCPPEYANAMATVDKGYDSYSISSTDSYPGPPGSPHKPLGGIQEECLLHVDVAKMTHVSKAVVQRALQDPFVEEVLIQRGPMEYEKLWAQSDWLIRRSYEKEQIGDLEVAAFLSDCAAAKARVSMEAPYSNGQTLIAAKMKHSSCVMRSNMIYKRVKEIEMETKKRHRELETIHSRQGSRDSRRSGNHSRQNSRELLPPPPDCMLSDPMESSVAVYATLPKKSARKKLVHDEVDSAADAAPRVPPKNFSVKEFLEAEGDQERKTMSLMRSNSNPTGLARSGDEAGETSTPKDPKKVHKIKRKLMGGFLRRKNRSLPDLRDAEDSGAVSAPEDCGSLKVEKAKAAQISPMRGFHQTNRNNRPQLVKVTCPTVAVPEVAGKTVILPESPKPESKGEVDFYEDPKYAVPTIPKEKIRVEEERTEEQRKAFLGELQRKRAQLHEKRLQEATKAKNDSKTSFTRSSSIRSTSSNGSTGSDGMRRPPRPPDYETALQRRELMKKQRASISSSIDEELSNLPPPPSDILATPPLVRAQLASTSTVQTDPDEEEKIKPDLLKPRTLSTSSTGSTKKKSVTFSDQVELVSCAEEIVDDFVPNPLLERVLKQHKEKVQEQLNSSMESVSSSPDSVMSGTTNASSTGFTCNLCHVKTVPANVTYCPDCAFYMSRFQTAD
ncbi:hypothetical protein BIW11_01095 [Tropilaelaps mercedesae]|uniref:USP domain-containing protein n=1 Tax=Tropilaelaps mercedesae TaxID=418985 RepID=A0A1V9XK19_9ACAR|nr:hypothetical protein BIW11_01095 [Tropilaelaps mercedesae]